MTKISRGFSLIELAMVMAIIAILIVAVYSAFGKQVTKSRRSDAKTMLLKLSQEQENYRADQDKYAESVASLPSCKKQENCLSEQGFYEIKIDKAGATTFELQAVPASSKAQINDTQCTKFTIDQSGRKYAEAGGKENTADCW